MIPRRAFCPLCGEAVLGAGFVIYRNHVFCSACGLPPSRRHTEAVALLSHSTLVRFVTTTHAVRFFAPLEPWYWRRSAFDLATEFCPQTARIFASIPFHEEQ